MHPAAIALALSLLAPAAAEPVRVTAVTKDGRHGGTLSVDHVDVQVGPRVVKVAMGEVASIRFGETDVVHTRGGRRVKGVVSVEGWTLRADGKNEPRPLARDTLRFVVPRVPLGKPARGRVVDAAAANGMTYHVRLPEKYDAAAGGAAIVLLHGSNANSADYVKGVAQRWPKLAADYVLIGVDGEWPTQKDPDGPPAFVYTYVNFVGRSKYKGFPGTDRESPALVAEALAEIKQQLKLTRVFVAGHSQGGFLSYSCLMNYPDLFAGAVPISAGLIFQCEPTAYEDEELRRLQRQRPIAIVHGDRDPLVSPAMATSAYESFLGDGFPMVRLLTAKGAAHAFIALPFEEAVRWVESMTADDPTALLRSAEQALGRREYRNASAYLKRASELDRGKAHAAAADALRRKLEQLAAASARTLLVAVRRNDGNGWVADFDAFRRQFEFTDAAAEVMAEYATLRKLHEPAAEKLWGEARRAFSAGDKDRGYRTCEEIVGKHYASTYYRHARQTLAEKK